MHEAGYYPHAKCCSVIFHPFISMLESTADANSNNPYQSFHSNLRITERWIFSKSLNVAHHDDTDAHEQ